MGIGYGLRGFAGGFQTGIGLGLERKKLNMIQEEQKRAEKLAKDKEDNAMSWYNTNKDSLMNFQTQPQDIRNMLIFESTKYSDDWNDYLRDSEKALQAGDLEELKHLNDMEEEKIKAERDMLDLGITAENGFIGKHYTEKDMDYVKKLRMGALSNKPIGTAMYEERSGELPVATEQPKLVDYNTGLKYLTSIINAPPENWESAKKNLETKYGLDYSSVTQESLKIPEKITEPKITTPAPTSTENIREDILNADTFADANRIYKNYTDKYDETALGITDLKQEWANGQIDYLNKVKKSIESLLVDRGDKGQWLSNKPVTQEEIGLEFKGERPASEIYEILYKSYIEYLEKLRKLGIDINQFPELLPLSEIEKVGGTEGFFGLEIQKGDYKNIYK